MDKLQLSLIALGSLGLIGLFGYNKWQESRARRHAEHVFGADHRDVLLDDASAPSPHAPDEAEVRIEPGERIEPVDATPHVSWEAADAPSVGRATLNPTVLRSAIAQTSGHAIAEDEAAAPDEAVAAEPMAVAAEPMAVAVAESSASLPREVDAHVDCVLRFEPDSPTSASDVMSAYAANWPQPLAGLRWYGLPVGAGGWRALTAGSYGQFSAVVAAVQLASRSGAIAEELLEQFLDGAARFADQIDCAVTLPDSRLVAHQAAELDRFCASVDVMVGVNVLAHEQPFHGTKIRGLAEAAGMKLGADGVYRAFDEDGSELFGLASLENTGFSADNLRTLQTRGLTLTLDVPRVANGKRAFERMLLLARQLAEALKGRLVDDNQSPLADAALALIREQILTFHKQMAGRSIPPGSSVALRVFS